MSEDPAATGSGLVVRVSPYTFPETVRRLSDEVARRGLHLFARIDHAAGARRAGLDLPPTAVLIFGNPRVGTPVMRACPDFALELPSRILVRTRADGSVLVIHHDAVRLAARYGLPSESVQELAALSRFVAAALTGEGR